ncbi:hypothetical protein [Pseudomonas sp. TWR3-1-1]|uniref:hypothetical protein n=1 Tax=Pseudomonas sp. TWR3-1-1 TaxID=2804633 RepID=UPI003CF4BBA6
MHYEKKMLIVHNYRGSVLYLKFYWAKPNDIVPLSINVVESSEISGFGITAAELTGDWPNYQSALADALATANRFIDSQLG